MAAETGDEHEKVQSVAKPFHPTPLSTKLIHS